MSPLYDRIAQLKVENVREKLHKLQGPKVNDAKSVAKLGWKTWVQSYRDLLYLETLHTLDTVLEEDGRPEYDVSIWMTSSNPNWFFDHYNKLRPEQMHGMVFRLSTDEGVTFPWLGVLENSRVVVLNRALEKHKQNEDGSVSFRVKIKLLVSIVSDGRRYEACENKDDSKPVFADAVMGISPGRSSSKNYYSPSKSEQIIQLNNKQTGAARWWVRTSGNPHFMMLQGPPGTGKTRTAVEILRRSLTVSGKKKDLTLHKIVCAAPSWTAVYQFAGRFMANCPPNVRVAMTGCGDRTRAAADEPVSVQHISVASMMADIQSFIRSMDRTEQTLTQLLKRIKQQATELSRELIPLLRKVVRKEGLAGAADELQRQSDEIKEQAFEEAHVVFATLNALGAPQVKNVLDRSVDTLIIDEAGQASDPDLFIGCALKPKRLLLIGDHQQLPPMVANLVAKSRGLEYSTLERLFDRQKLPGGTDASHIHVLRMQYRMPSEVLKWPNSQYYNGNLLTDYTPDATWEGMRYRFIDVHYGTQERRGTSYLNTAEAAHVVHAAFQLKQRGASPAEILIITPYAQQKRLICTYVSTYFPGVDKPAVSTIDGCQGAEREHVILSLVRTENMKKSFAVEPKHLCVALTRAQQTMTIIGNAACLLDDGTDDIKDLVRDAKERKVVIKACKQESYEGGIVGKLFVANDGTAREVDGIGFPTVDGDKVRLHLTDSNIVIAIDRLKESPLWKKDIACYLQNDRNVCFEAPYHDDREAILAAVRQIAVLCDGVLCNGREVVVCDRQPVDDRFITLTMPDVALAHQLITGKQKVHIWVEEHGVSMEKHVPVSIPQEPRYHKLCPIGTYVPIRVPASQVVKHKVNESSIIVVQLSDTSERDQLMDGVWADIKYVVETGTGGKKDPILDYWLQSMAGNEAHLEELREQLQNRSLLLTNGPMFNSGSVRAEAGEVFTMSTSFVSSLSTALSCSPVVGGGWTVKLYTADPKVTSKQLEHRVSQRAADLQVLSGVVRMMPDEILSDSVLVAGTKRRCIVFTARVGADGAVLDTSFSSEECDIRANFQVKKMDDWHEALGPFAGQGPNVLREAVQMMMGARRFVQEALHSNRKRKVKGPVHAMQYVTALAERSAGGMLGATYNNCVLFDNRLVDVCNETVLCNEKEQAMEHSSNEQDSLNARAAVALLRPSQSALHEIGYHYVQGTSGVLFTRPLQLYSDYSNLQRIKECVQGKPVARCTAADLHRRSLIEKNARRCAKDIELLVIAERTPKKVDVVVANDDGDRLYCPHLDTIFPAARRVGNHGQVLHSLLTCAAWSSLRPEPYHVVPYAKKSLKEAGDGWVEVSKSKPRKPVVRRLTDKPRPCIRFAGQIKKELKAVEHSVVAKMLYTVLAEHCGKLASAVYPVRDQYGHNQPHDTNKYWVVLAKTGTCRNYQTGRRCNKICTYYHGDTGDAMKLFKDNFNILSKAAEAVGTTLGCWLKVSKTAAGGSTMNQLDHASKKPAAPALKQQSPGGKQPSSTGPLKGILTWLPNPSGNSKHSA